MSEPRKKRGRPRGRPAPILSYGSEIKMRYSIARKIKKPKYLREEINDKRRKDRSRSRSSTPKINDNDNDEGNNKGGRNGRGYNPDIEDKDSEFHYGSDFESDENSNRRDSDEHSKAGSDDESGGGDEPLGLSDDNSQISDEEIDTSIFTERESIFSDSRPLTPVPVWLQDRDYSPLFLPPSSDDILLPSCFVLQAVGIYEILRHFRTLVRLSPFRFEEFCVALLVDEQSSLLAEVHIALLKSLIREEDSQQTHFGPLDQKDSVNIVLYFIDTFTWPEVLKCYLQSDQEFSKMIEILESCEYPFTTLENRYAKNC